MPLHQWATPGRGSAGFHSHFIKGQLESRQGPDRAYPPVGATVRGEGRVNHPAMRCWECYHIPNDVFPILVSLSKILVWHTLLLPSSYLLPTPPQANNFFILFCYYIILLVAYLSSEFFSILTKNRSPRHFLPQVPNIFPSLLQYFANFKFFQFRELITQANGDDLFNKKPVNKKSLVSVSLTGFFFSYHVTYVE